MVPITFLWCFGIYSLVVRYEEQHLLKKYGESYYKFMTEVPRWAPKTVRLKDIKFINEFFRAAVAAEIHCLFILLPYLLKELIRH